MGGHKVLVTQRFRGREIAHSKLGLDHLHEVAKALEHVSKVEQPPRMVGRACNLVLAPDKPKIEAVKRKLEKEKADEEAKKAKPESSAGGDAEGSEAQVEEAAARQ
jgi:translation initiation factor IF-3